MKNKKTIFAVAGICLLGIIAGTFAYFSTTDLFHNLFTTDYYQIDTYEVFESPENWRPGDTTPKTISVNNNGNVDAAVRISFTEEWTDKNGGYLYTTQDSKSAAIINFADDYEENWQSIGEWNASVYTKYYYFRNKLSPGETTPNLIESVTFNPEFVASTKETCVTDDATHKKSCTVTPGGYEDATYKLTIKIETVQYNMYKTAWNTSAKIYTSHPYNFSDHIRSLVDTDDVANDDPYGNYRYIGANPKNYVRYNNELWRILGSYDYGYVKIIRDEPLGQFCFDSSEHSINNGKGINLIYDCIETTNEH